MSLDFAQTQTDTSYRIQEIQVEVDDNDSAFGDNDFPDSTRSLDSAIEDYVYENGRRYHGYKSGKYVFPNDETEAMREDMKHHMLKLLLSDRIHTVHFEQPPLEVLDIGTGTGIWAIDFADENPASHVIGLDLSPMQPKLVPPNLEFQIDDVEDQWTFQPASKDYVHIRNMSSAIKDWPKLVSQAKSVLKLGGIIELSDMDIFYTSDDNTVTDSNRLKIFMNDAKVAASGIGLDLAACYRFENLLRMAGFEDVHTEWYKLPMGSWPKDRSLKEVGIWHRAQFLEGMQAIALGTYGRALRWSAEQIEVHLAGVRQDIMDKRVHGYWLMGFTTARRK